MYYVYTARPSVWPTSGSSSFPVIYVIISSCIWLILVAVVIGLTVACALRGVLCSVRYCLKLHFVSYHFLKGKKMTDLERGIRYAMHAVNEL